MMAVNKNLQPYVLFTVYIVLMDYLLVLFCSVAFMTVDVLWGIKVMS
jgi:hypothetical protein